MDSPRQDLETFRKRMDEAQAAAAAGLWADARRALEQAIALDPLQPKPLEALADVMRNLHDPDRAEELRQRAKTLRQEQWQRQVEAEIRGQHELIGSAARHEIP